MPSTNPGLPPKQRAHSAFPRRGRSRRRRRTLVAIAIVTAIVASLLGASVIAYSSLKADASKLQAQLTTHLELGQQELEAAKTSLRLANANLDDKMIGQAKVHFIQAKLQFMTAAQIADSSDLLQRAESIPSVGELARSQHKAVDEISQMGINIAASGLELADIDGQLLRPTGAGQAPKTLLAVVDLVHAKLGPVRNDLLGARKAAGAIDLAVIPARQRASFQKAKGTIDQALTAIAQFEAVVPVIRELLGADGARNYLIEQVNPAELRPGGGFIGTYSVIRADYGALSLIKSGDAVELIMPRVSVGQPGYVTPPGPIREFVPTTSWSFIDSNFFPDFVSNARTAQTFANPHLPFKVDGVISIDYYAVAKMLQLTGPLAVPGFQLSVTADTIVPLVIEYDLRSDKDPQANAIHKAILAALSGPLFQRITGLSPAQWPGLIGVLNELAAQRHLQAYFNNSEVEKTIDQYGWSGVQKPAAAPDYMMEVEANLGGTKANYFVDRHYVIELTRSGGALHHKMTVQVWDNMPYSYRPNEFYRGYVRLYLSDKGTGTSSGLLAPKYLSPQAPAGTKMLDGWFFIHGYGHDVVFGFEWDTPWQPNGRGQEQIYWQKQPGTPSDLVDVIWKDGNGHTYKASGNLVQDLVITLAPSAVTITQGQVGTAQLPSLNLG